MSQFRIFNQNLSDKALVISVIFVSQMIPMCSKVETNDLDEVSANFFYEKPDKQILRLLGPYHLNHTQLRHCDRRATKDNRGMNECGCMPIKLTLDAEI